MANDKKMFDDSGNLNEELPYDVNIPKFFVPEQDIAFPEGIYVAALGRIKAINKEDDPDVVRSVSNELWILRYLGTADKPVDDDVRINVEGDKIEMADSGTKLVEFYPNPQLNKKQAFKARAFFSHFGAIRKPPEGGESYIDWAEVVKRYGTIFTFEIVYVSSKDKTKKYRNIAYDTIKVEGKKLPAEDMMMIEDEWQARAKARAEAAEKENEPKTDLPF